MELPSVGQLCEGNILHTLDCEAYLGFEGGWTWNKTTCRHFSWWMTHGWAGASSYSSALGTGSGGRMKEWCTEGQFLNFSVLQFPHKGKKHNMASGDEQNPLCIPLIIILIFIKHVSPVSYIYPAGVRAQHSFWGCVGCKSWMVLLLTSLTPHRTMQLCPLWLM